MLASSWLTSLGVVVLRPEEPELRARLPPSRWPQAQGSLPAGSAVREAQREPGCSGRQPEGT